jgi:hypothetical protein
VASPFDVRALIGRLFGEVLDDLAPGWATWGFSARGRLAAPIERPLSEEEMISEIRSNVALIVAALCDGTVELIDIEGKAVPLWVWFSGRWTFHREEEPRREKLVVRTAADKKVEFYNLAFTEPAGAGTRKRRPKRRPGAKEIDDSAELAAARELVVAGKSDHAAAKEVAWARFPGTKDDNRRRKLARRVREKLGKAIDRN